MKGKYFCLSNFFRLQSIFSKTQTSKKKFITHCMCSVNTKYTRIF